YYLKDPYLNTYLKLINPKVAKIGQGAFQNGQHEPLDTKALSQYLGYAFERFCRENHFVLAKILSIAGVEYSYGPYQLRSDGEGFQFDLLFDRKDRCITIF